MCNVPDYCIDEVADHTLAFILATTRQVVRNSLQLKAGKPGLATPLDRMLTLSQLTIGIVGFGRIGREVTAQLIAFKCRASHMIRRYPHRRSKSTAVSRSISRAFSENPT